MTYPDENTVLGWERYRAARTGVRPPKRCKCGDVGFMCHDVDPHDARFGVLVPCPKCNAAYAVKHAPR